MLNFKNLLLSLGVVLVSTANINAYCLPSFLKGYLSNNRASTTTTKTASPTSAKLNSWASKHPVEKKAAIDGAVGAAAGGVVGLISHRGLLHGALMGAGSGAGIGLATSSKYLQHHKIEKDAAVVGIGGLGLWLASKKGHGLL